MFDKSQRLSGSATGPTEQAGRRVRSERYNGLFFGPGRPFIVQLQPAAISSTQISGSGDAVVTLPKLSRGCMASANCSNPGLAIGRVSAGNSVNKGTDISKPL
jgi:hypothetical protein